jgi:hypothetical protein
MNRFFILSLPRSRSTWLTAYLYGDCCTCYHDFLSSSFIDTSIFWKVKDKYVGSVDTNPVIAKGYLRDLEAPLVIIKRNPNDVIDSLCKLFGTKHKDFISKAIERLSKALTEAEAYADLIINYEDIDTRLKEIWETCCPNRKYDPIKSVIFTHTNINMKGLNFKDFEREVNLLCHL